METRKVVILGSGPAGLTAALYAARAELEPLVIAGPDLGGQVSITHLVENYPGFPEGVGGQALVERLKTQAERFGAEIRLDLATGVDLSQRPFRVTLTKGEVAAETLIVATGAKPRTLGVPGEEDLVGMGVSYCATCDGHFFKGMEVVVVGGGDSALEEGLFLTRYATTVTIIHRRAQLRAGRLLQKRARNHPKIRFVLNTVVTEILGEDEVEAVRLRDVSTGAERLLPTAGVFIFIGYEPNTEMFQGQLALDQQGYLKVDCRTRTNVPGVFAAGEVADPRYRQVITSAGMGARAAMEAVHFLSAEAL